MTAPRRCLWNLGRTASSSVSYRVDAAPVPARRGWPRALGLSIVKHIVQAHGGEVWMKSELAIGHDVFSSRCPRDDSVEAQSQGCIKLFILAPRGNEWVRGPRRGGRFRKLDAALSAILDPATGGDIFLSRSAKVCDTSPRNEKLSMKTNRLLFVST
jgi:hypothetical protein